MAQGYQIVDEPQPGALSSIAVQPMWPLLGVMFGGSWLSWPWFVLNAFAIGSPTRWRELALACAGFAGNAVLNLGVGALRVTETVPESAGAYLVLIPIVWKLAVSYGLFALASRTFGIYEYFGGKVQNGLTFLLAGFVLNWMVITPLFRAVPLLTLVLA